jgi:hypothetical protein
LLFQNRKPFLFLDILQKYLPMSYHVAYAALAP